MEACRRHMWLAACFSALINVLYLAPTIYMMQVYDRVVPTGGIATLLWITVVVAAAIATLAALEAVRGQLMSRVSLRLDRILAGTILDRLVARKTSDEASGLVMREFDSFRAALSGPAMTAMFDTPWTPIYFAVAFMIHPLLGLLVLLGGVILIALAVAHSRKSKPMEDEARQANSLSYASQNATLRQSEIVRTLGMRRAMIARHVGDRHSGQEAGSRVQAASNRYNSLVKFARMFLQSFALGVGAWLAIEGQITSGAIIAASVLLSRALQPLEQLVRLWPSIIQARQSMTTLAELFEETDTDVAVRTKLPDPTGVVSLDRVVVRSNDGAALLLKNVSLELAPGEICGIIGASGAGKTTLARVVAGAIQPDLGEVRLDGASIADWDREVLAPHTGYLPQGSALLQGTVGENISRFAVDGGADRSEVDARSIEAAQLAGIHDMVLALPLGSDTPIQEGGMKLSAGQEQRVALARALYGNPKIIVLDEPNSALDTDGEAALGRALDVMRKRGATIMVVAHRAQVLATADKLAVLSGGEIVQHGERDKVLGALREAAERANVVPMQREGGK